MNHKPKLQWRADYGNDTLWQYSQDYKKENMFKDIDLNRLVKFELINENVVYSVNLTNGVFFINGIELVLDIPPNTQPPFRLIYFRRVRQSFSTTSQIPKNTTVVHHIGWQITINDKNHQRILAVPEHSPKQITLIYK